MPKLAQLGILQKLTSTPPCSGGMRHAAISSAFAMASSKLSSGCIPVRPEAEWGPWKLEKISSPERNHLSKKGVMPSV